MFESLKGPEGALCCVKATSGADTGFQLVFLSKGAANVVFSCRPFSSKLPAASPSLHIVQTAHNGSHVHCVSTDIVRNKVLRIPRGMPKCLSGEEIVDGFSKYIIPLFSVDLSKHLMGHQLVALMPDIIEILAQKDENGLVRISEPATHPSRWAILLPDMSSTPGSSITVEVKPKWLTQSPNAPRNATRCRTCAMQIIHPKNRKTYICPLRLVNGDRNDIYPWVYETIETMCRIPSNGFGLASSKSLAYIAEAVTKYLTSGEGRTLLQHLRKLQSSLDPHGVMQRPPRSDSFDHNLRLAMTLRDCSLFIKIAYNKSGESSDIVSKLADLDFKSAEKIPDWAEKEVTLQAEGAYIRNVKDDVGCWLTRKS